MKKILFIISYSLYLFVLLGFFFHTSAHPSLFNKYTLHYFLFLVLIVMIFPGFLILSWGMLQGLSFHIKNKKYHFSSKKILLLLTVIIICGVIAPAEIFLRNKYNDVESNAYTYSLDHFHPFLQFQIARDYTTMINSDGFRGEEIKKNKPKNVYRIFLLGGSTVLNKNVPYEKTSARVLEKLLQKQYPSHTIEVINAGVDAYTSEHSLIQYLFNIKDYSPDLVVMWHGINDLIYSCTTNDHTYGKFKADYSHNYSADSAMVFNYFKPEPLFRVKLLLFDQIKIAMEQNWYSDIFSKITEKYPGIYSDNFKNKTRRMDTFPSLGSYERNLQSLIDAVKSDHVNLILGNQPNLYATNLSEKEKKSLFFPKLHCSNSEGKYPDLNSMIGGIHLFNVVTEKIAEANNIPFMDLEKVIPKTSDYFTDDVHNTNKGNEVIGTFLFEEIKQQNTIN